MEKLLRGDDEGSFEFMKFKYHIIGTLFNVGAHVFGLPLDGTGSVAELAAGLGDHRDFLKSYFKDVDFYEGSGNVIDTGYTYNGVTENWYEQLLEKLYLYRDYDCIFGVWCLSYMEDPVLE